VAGAGVESAGLALVEIYRDVITGHPNEAIAIFEERLPVLRDQLGHRVADAYALAARAYDLLGRTVEAQAAYAKATVLSPLTELHRRYPELEKLAGRYQPSPAPPEAA
jgi:tetratricopeptide (TPR) repeat protein